MSTEFADFVAGSLRNERFTLVDVGCGMGLHPSWRVFGKRLRALGLDAGAEECARLAKAETAPDIHYRGAFVGMPPDHPFAKAYGTVTDWRRNPFPRTSAQLGGDLLREKIAKANLEEKLLHNAWHITTLGDPAKPVFVPDVLAELGWTDVDALKIDIDGADFMVLNSLDGHLERLGVLAVQLEVNLFGGVEPWEHTFHNTDRFMREHGYVLFALEPRSYSMAKLPARYAMPIPAETVTGRVYQAEAYYALDPAAPDADARVRGLSAEKLAKLAAVLSIWRQADSAAELLVDFRDRFDGLLDVSRGLDILAAQVQSGVSAPLGYTAYLADFRADPTKYYPRQGGAVPLIRRLQAALAAWRDPERLRS